MPTFLTEACLMDPKGQCPPKGLIPAQCDQIWPDQVSALVTVTCRQGYPTQFLTAKSHSMLAFSYQTVSLVTPLSSIEEASGVGGPSSESSSFSTIAHLMYASMDLLGPGAITQPFLHGTGTDSSPSQRVSFLGET